MRQLDEEMCCQQPTASAAAATGFNLAYVVAGGAYKCDACNDPISVGSVALVRLVAEQGRIMHKNPRYGRDSCDWWCAVLYIACKPECAKRSDKWGPLALGEERSACLVGVTAG